MEAPGKRSPGFWFPRTTVTTGLITFSEMFLQIIGAT